MQPLEGITTKYLIKCKHAHVSGTCALQIYMNIPVMVNLDSETDPLKIVEKELQECKIPIIIQQYLLDGLHKDWSMEELVMD